MSNIKSNNQALLDAYFLINSDKFDFSTPRDKAVRLDINEPNKLNILADKVSKGQIPSDFVTIDQTKGAIKLEEFLSKSNLTIVERDYLLLEANNKFLRQASGNLSVIIGDNFGLSTFRTYDMPEILGNEKVNTLNNVSKNSYEVALLNDRQPFKDEAYGRIVSVLKGEANQDHLFIRRTPAHMEVDALSQAVRSYLGDELLNAENNLKKSRKNLVSAAGSIKSHEAIETFAKNNSKLKLNFFDHYKSKVRLESITNQFWGDYQKSIGKFSELGAKVTSPDAIKNIRQVADKILTKQNLSFGMSDLELATKSVALVDSHKRSISESSEHKLSQLDNDKIETYLGRKR